MTTGAWVLLIAVVAAVAFGLWRAARDGRFRGTHKVAGALDEGEVSAKAGGRQIPVWEGIELGERATLLQFSSAFCAPCRATRVVLAEVASGLPGVVHQEIDAEHHLDLVRRVGVSRTPTTLILGPDGAELTRAVGAPRKALVLESLNALGIT